MAIISLLKWNDAKLFKSWWSWNTLSGTKTITRCWGWCPMSKSNLPLSITCMGQGIIFGVICKHRKQIMSIPPGALRWISFLTISLLHYLRTDLNWDSDKRNLSTWIAIIMALIAIERLMHPQTHRMWQEYRYRIKLKILEIFGLTKCSGQTRITKLET